MCVKSKFTAPKEHCYSNQVLDTQILCVVSVKERNSRIVLSAKFSKFRDNQPKRKRPKICLLYPTEDVEHYPLNSKNQCIILQCSLQSQWSYTVSMPKLHLAVCGVGLEA